MNNTEGRQDINEAFELFDATFFSNKTVNFFMGYGKLINFYFMSYIILYNFTTSFFLRSKRL